MTYAEVEKIADNYLFPLVRDLYSLDGYEIKLVDRGYEICDGQNAVYYCTKEKESPKVLRISLNNRSCDELLAEAEYVRWLFENGGNVSNVISSKNGNLVEEITHDSAAYFFSLFDKAKGKQFHENGYRYRKGVPIAEYYYNIGKTIGKLHQLSKEYNPIHRRYSFFDKYNAKYVNELIPDCFTVLKFKLNELFDELEALGCGHDIYGMVHLDYNDSNYSIDFETGQITVYDFDNSCFGWYMFDLAYTWMYLVGWAIDKRDSNERKALMDSISKSIFDGYKSETALDDKLQDKFPFFINVAMMIHIVEAFEYIRKHGEEPEYDFELSYLIKCFEDDIPYMGFFHEIFSCETPFECGKLAVDLSAL